MKKLVLISLMLAMTGIASATPGAVNRKGCHSKPKHCHSLGVTLKMKNGRRYVPFGQG